MRTEPGPLSAGTQAFPLPAATVLASGERRWDALVYSCEPGYRPLFLDLRVPSAEHGRAFPVVVWVHGGGWVFGSRRRQSPNLHANRLLERIVEAGFAVAVLDYRLAKEAPFPAANLDIRAAIRWLRGNAALFDLDPAHVSLWGESAGGHLVLMHALGGDFRGTTRTGEYLHQPESVEAVVDWYGPADLVTMRADLRETVTDADERGLTDEDPLALLTAGTDWDAASISPIRNLPGDGTPIFIAHGADDRQVPVRQSRALHQALRQAGVVTDYLETAGDHVFVVSGEQVLPHVIEQSLNFVRSCASAAPRGEVAFEADQRLVEQHAD